VSDGAIEEVRARAGEQHGHAHDEDPDQKLRLGMFRNELCLRDHVGRCRLQGESSRQEVCRRNCQQDEGNQGDAGNAVGLEAVGAGADRVACVVSGAVCDDAGVARIVFLDLEDDLHEVCADVGDLGEDATGNTQGRCAEGFADGEADEAWPA